MNDEALFDKYGIGSFRDAVLQGSGISLEPEQLRRLFLRLPSQLQTNARAWGLSDTVVGDEICSWAKNNPSHLSSV